MISSPFERAVRLFPLVKCSLLNSCLALRRAVAQVNTMRRKTSVIPVARRFRRRLRPRFRSQIGPGTGLSCESWRSSACLDEGSRRRAFRHMVTEHGRRRLRFKVIAPGALATDFSGAPCVDPEVNRLLASHTALGRVAGSDDIGPRPLHCWLTRAAGSMGSG